MNVLFAIAMSLLVASGLSAQEAAPTADAANLEGAYLRRMQSDLRNLMSAQEIHYAGQMMYAGPVDDVNVVEALRFHSSEGVRIRIVAGDERGWSATATMTELPGRGCAVFVGNAAAPATPGGLQPTEQGRVVCD